MRARRPKLRCVVAIGFGVVAALGGGVATAGSSPPTSAGPAPVVTDPVLPDTATDAGDVTVVLPTNRNETLTEGDSNSVFAVQIPVGSTCPGDSANDGWRVQTFIVPAGVDLATLRYGATRPKGELMYALYTTEGRPYTQVLLAQNPQPGMPGQILDVPPLSFAPFTPDLLPVGRYQIGVACSYFEVGERFWDAELEISEDDSVQPGERRWAVVNADGEAVATASASGVGVPTPVVVGGIAGLAAIALAAALWFTRRRQTHHLKERP